MKKDIHFTGVSESFRKATADGLVIMSPDIIIQLRLLNNDLIGLRGEKIPHYLKKSVVAIEGKPSIRKSKNATGFTYCNLNSCL